jgi:type IV pilus assembly protein PilC
MKLDEFAFFNQQLGRMLQDGIPLEGALQRLCAHMRRGRLRAELEALGRDLAEGRSLDAALAGRRLPDLYVRLLKIGARTNSLPSLLLLLADHYQRVSALWTRLKGLLVYPVLVLLLALGVSIHIARIMLELRETTVGLTFRESHAYLPGAYQVVLVDLLVPPCLLTFLLAVLVACLAAPGLRRRLRWRVPAFKDAALSRLASVLSLCLRSGAPLGEALGLARDLEGQSPAARDLAEWQQRAAEGRTRFADIALSSRRFPKLFIWLVDSAGEDLPGGLAQAAAIYHERAAHRAEMALYGVLPVSILILGLMLFAQTYSVVGTLTQIMQSLGQG